MTRNAGIADTAPFKSTGTDTCQVIAGSFG